MKEWTDVELNNKKKKHGGKVRKPRLGRERER